MSQECRCFLLTLQRYDNFPSKTNFLLIFVETTCDKAAHLRQSAGITAKTVADQGELGATQAVRPITT